MLRGKVIHIGQPMSGVSKTKGTPWKKQEFVIETEGQYPTTIAFSAMNEKIDQAAIQLGNVVEVEVNLRSREYNGKWYTEATAWRIRNISAQSQQGGTAPQGYAAPSQGYAAAPQPFAQTANDNNPLPF